MAGSLIVSPCGFHQVTAGEPIDTRLSRARRDPEGAPRALVVIPLGAPAAA